MHCTPAFSATEDNDSQSAPCGNSQNLFFAPLRWPLSFCLYYTVLACDLQWYSILFCNFPTQNYDWRGCHYPEPLWLVVRIKSDVSPVFSRMERKALSVLWRNPERSPWWAKRHSGVYRRSRRCRTDRRQSSRSQHNQITNHIAITQMMKIRLLKRL